MGAVLHAQRFAFRLRQCKSADHLLLHQLVFVREGASAHIDFQFEDEPIASVRDDPRGELGRQAIRREADLCFFPGDRVYVLNGAYNHDGQAPTALTEGTVVACEGSRAAVRLDWEMADKQAVRIQWLLWVVRLLESN